MLLYDGWVHYIGWRGLSCGWANESVGVAAASARHATDSKALATTALTGFARAADIHRGIMQGVSVVTASGTRLISSESTLGAAEQKQCS